MSFYGLAPLSWCYLGGLRVRHWLYDKNLLSKQFAPLPVVSIGNLVAGGAGKTQASLLLAKELERFFPIAVLSRGYKSWAEHAPDPLLVDITKHSARRAGDEPWLLASRLPSDSAFVIVNKCRFKSALAAQRWGARLLILDDGMQHRSLHRDFEIVVIDGKTRWGPFLPRGRLREDPARLKHADAILFIDHPSREILEQVSDRTDAPQIVAQIESEGVFDLSGTDFGTLQGKKVGLFCGIGNPSRFVKTVEQLGAEVISTLFSPDHQIPEENALQSFIAKAKKKGADLIVCTEKDKVKLSPTQRPLPVVWIQAGLRVIKNHEAWLKMVGEMKLIAGGV